MEKLLQIEELAKFIVVIIALRYQPVHLPWWLWPIVFLLPDVGMAGYLVNTQIGALTYNLFHHKAIAIVLIGIGWYFQQPVILLAGLVLYGHSSMDRMLGFGLKYGDAFKHTHLGAALA